MQLIIGEFLPSCSKHNEQVWLRVLRRVTLETSCAVWMACRPGSGCWLCRQSEFHEHNREG